MKKLLIAVLLFIPLILSAQSKGHLGLELGTATPLSPDIFKTYWGTGFNLGFVFDKPVSKIFSYGAEFNYSAYIINESGAGVNLDSGSSGGPYGISQLLAAAIISDNYSASTITPYGKLGLGLSYSSVIDLISTNGTKKFAGIKEYGLGVMLAAGLNFNLKGGNKITLEGSYRLSKRSGESYNSFLVDAGYCFGM